MLTKILNALNSEVLNELDLAKSIHHPGESGRAREQILGEFIKKLLPKSFDVSTGFVIDATGAMSRQIDLVIYRNDYHPVFNIGGINHFMVESVAAVIENKSSIKSSKALKQALENIKSVKALDRTNKGKNTTCNEEERNLVNPNAYQHQIFGAILTEESLSKDRLAEELLKYLESNPRKLWPNLYVDVRHTTGFFYKKGKPNLGFIEPKKAKYLVLTDETQENFVPPLLDLAFDILSFLRVSPQIDYNPDDYLKLGSSPGDSWKIDTKLK
jgi:hypothetical protein